jgi:hypothetical protein
VALPSETRASITARDEASWIGVAGKINVRSSSPKDVQAAEKERVVRLDAVAPHPGANDFFVEWQISGVEEIEDIPTEEVRWPSSES